MALQLTALLDDPLGRSGSEGSSSGSVKDESDIVFIDSDCDPSSDASDDNVADGGDTVATGGDADVTKGDCNERDIEDRRKFSRQKSYVVPALFTDPAYKKTGGGGNYILSTSTIGFTGILV